jgi:hypothetical protein
MMRPAPYAPRAAALDALIRVLVVEHRVSDGVQGLDTRLSFAGL